MSKIKAVAFDLDDTLAHSKSAISPTMATMLIELAEILPVCVISGGRFEQFQGQLLSNLPYSACAFTNLHLMPTCGTRYFRYQDGGWALIYAEDLSVVEKSEATEELERVAKELGFWEADHLVHGERIEDRGSQITYSALGQLAPVSEKRLWDPEGAKRAQLQVNLQQALPHLEVRSGGSTSIDITSKGIDKAYGIREFADLVDANFAEILFIGDRLEPGGNDYPVISLGVMTRAVKDCDETEEILPSLISSVRESDGL